MWSAIGLQGSLAEVFQLSGVGGEEVGLGQEEAGAAQPVGGGTEPRATHPGGAQLLLLPTPWETQGGVYPWICAGQGSLLLWDGVRAAPGCSQWRERVGWAGKSPV